MKEFQKGIEDLVDHLNYCENKICEYEKILFIEENRIREDKSQLLKIISRLERENNNTKKCFELKVRENEVLMRLIKMLYKIGFLKLQ